MQFHNSEEQNGFPLIRTFHL